MELQSRFARPAPTCDPTGRRTLRQETPWFHRGLGSPPSSLLLLSLTSAAFLASAWKTPHRRTELSNNGVFCVLFLGWGGFLVVLRGRWGPSRIRPRQLCRRRLQLQLQLSGGAPASQPASRGNADQVERMKHSWLFFFFSNQVSQAALWVFCLREKP